MLYISLLFFLLFYLHLFFFLCFVFFFFFKQNTAYEMRISDWSSDVCSSDLAYAELDIADLQARMTDGNLGSRELTQAYLDRIAAIDDAGPRLNAVIELNPDALEEADARDAEREAG